VKLSKPPSKADCSALNLDGLGDAVAAPLRSGASYNPRDGEDRVLLAQHLVFSVFKVSRRFSTGRRLDIGTVPSAVRCPAQGLFDWLDGDSHQPCGGVVGTRYPLPTLGAKRWVRVATG
jgi:hypothetical protein